MAMQRASRNDGGNLPDDEAIEIGRAVGERVALICEARDIHESALCEHIGAYRGSISSLKRRRGSRVSAVFLLRVADALDVDFEWILTGRGSVHAFARKGFRACGILPTSSLWPAGVGLLVEPLVIDPPRAPVSRK